ncbi:MAG: response regulator transcription factor [Firmicutes bacterium]|nr:response regulator transcription factor [Bacillota bacterium]
MENKITIVIVEDERAVADLLKTVLEANHYHVLTAKTAAEAEALISSHCPDVILLDLGLPDGDGLNLIRLVRKWSQVPILVVSARMQQGDKVKALDLGADDYITKPFGTQELLARIRTAIRHSRNAGTEDEAILQEGRLQMGSLVIDYNRRCVYLDGKDVHLTQNEYKIVALLGKHAGKVLTYDFLRKNIWGPNTGGNNQILRVNMANIRRKIEKNPADPRYIFTEVGVGYRMEDEESDSGS